MNATPTFAERLRELRIAADRSMDEVARALSITTVYYSEVENGKKHPFPPHSIDFGKLAQILGADRFELELLATAQRSHLGIALKPKSQRARDFVVHLARCINEDSLTEEEIEEINQVLQRRKGDGK